MKNILIIVFSLFLIISACRKTADCISDTGEKVSYEYNINSFDTLVINDNFNVSLIQDTVNKLIISAYEKYADATIFNIYENSLTLGNDYNCKFTKPEKSKINVKIHLKSISLIRVNAASKIISENTLINNNETGIIVNTKFFEADLKINCRVFYFWNTHLNGGKMYLQGKTNILKLWNTSLFAVDASKLTTDSAYIENTSKGDIYANVNEYLSCVIKSSGNVYYYGSPPKITVNDTISSGRLIKAQ